MFKMFNIALRHYALIKTINLLPNHSAKDENENCEITLNCNYVKIYSSFEPNYNIDTKFN